MEGKARFIFPAFLSGIMSFLLTCLVTFVNVGPVADFFSRWMHAWVIAWPAAYVAALIAAPFARRGTAFVIRLIDGEKPPVAKS